MEQLLADGALDVCWIPVQMKKHRPGTQIQVICPPAALEPIIRRILEETTTLGVRHHTVRRRILERCPETLETPLGPLQVKRVTSLEGRVRRVPEYEACRRIARERGLALRDVYAQVQHHLDQLPVR
jgi:uncharacterized protein (DUF111 family)